MKSFKDFGIYIDESKPGNQKTPCQKCSHTRKNKSDPCLSVNVDEGIWKCHHCGWVGSLGNGNKQSRNSIVATYDYKDESGKLLYQSVRFDPKSFCQRQPDGTGNWVWNLKNIRRVPYRLPELIASIGPVYIPGGEKDVETLVRHGLTATTNAGGEGNWWPEFNEHLKGKDVVILEDKDEKGRKHGKVIAEGLHGIANSIKIVRFDELPPGGDVTDYLSSNSKDDLTRVIGTLRVFGGLYSEYFNDSDNQLSSPKREPQWDPPILFGYKKLHEIPARLLPGAYGEFAGALSSATETSPAMSVSGIIGAVSAACSHHFFVSPKPGWNEPINVYILVAIGPGNQKSLVLRECTAPLIKWEREKAEVVGPEIQRARSERKTQEKIIDARRAAVSKIKDPDLRKLEIKEIADLEADLKETPVLPQIFATDATPESLAQSLYEQKEKFAIITDEGGIMEVISGLYTGGQANIDIILKGIDGGEVRVKRRDRSFDLTPYLTFCLFVQPAIIERMGQRQAFSGNGMLERFLYIIPETRIGYRKHDTEPVPESTRQAYHKALSALLSIKSQDARRLLTLAPEAFTEWRDFQSSIEKNLRPGGKLYSLPGWGGKICGYVLRLAGLVHVMENGAELLVISKETMDRALELGALLIDPGVTAFDLMGADKRTVKAHRVFEWIKSKGMMRFRKSICHRDLHGQFSNVIELDQALEELISRNIIIGPLKIKTGGRSIIEYEVNPAILEEAS